MRQDVRLPRGFRHEFFSMQLAEHFGHITGNDDTRDLVLHLIASHHGHARPFASLLSDELVANEKAPEVSLAAIGIDAKFPSTERQALCPRHRGLCVVPSRCCCWTVY